MYHVVGVLLRMGIVLLKQLISRGKKHEKKTRRRCEINECNMPLFMERGGKSKSIALTESYPPKFFQQQPCCWPVGLCWPSPDLKTFFFLFGSHKWKVIKAHRVISGWTRNHWTLINEQWGMERGGEMRQDSLPLSYHISHWGGIRLIKGKPVWEKKCQSC